MHMGPKIYEIRTKSANMICDYKKATNLYKMRSKEKKSDLWITKTACKYKLSAEMQLGKEINQ